MARKMTWFVKHLLYHAQKCRIWVTVFQQKKKTWRPLWYTNTKRTNSTALSNHRIVKIVTKVRMIIDSGSKKTSFQTPYYWWCWNGNAKENRLPLYFKIYFSRLSIATSNGWCLDWICLELGCHCASHPNPKKKISRCKIIFCKYNPMLELNVFMYLCWQTIIMQTNMQIEITREIENEERIWDRKSSQKLNTEMDFYIHKYI